MASSPPDFSDSGLMNYALRMVIPMRREFGRSLDVQHFLHDLAYAKEVLDEARTSQNPKLREHADYLNGKMFGPRTASAPAPSVSQRITDRAGAAVAADKTPAEKPGTLSAEEEAKQLMLAKYRSGLR